MTYLDIQQKIDDNKRQTEKSLIPEILNIIPDAKNIQFYDGNWIMFYSKGSDKRDKECVAKYDNNGIKSIIKQVDYFKKMRYMSNGQPISNCKIIY